MSAHTRTIGVGHSRRELDRLMERKTEKRDGVIQRACAAGTTLLQDGDVPNDRRIHGNHQLAVGVRTPDLDGPARLLPALADGQHAISAVVTRTQRKLLGL